MVASTLGRPPRRPGPTDAELAEKIRDAVAALNLALHDGHQHGLFLEVEIKGVRCLQDSRDMPVVEAKIARTL